MSEELDNQKQLTSEKQKQASYNQELAAQEEKRIEQSRLALENMKQMNLSYDKQVKMQSDIVRKMIEQAELTGDMTAEFRAFATLQSEANDVINSSIQLQENFFTKATGTIQTFVAASKARKKALEEISKLEDEVGDIAKDNLKTLMKENEKLTEQEAVRERIKELEEERSKTGEELSEQDQQELKLLKQKLVLKELELQKENQIKAAGLKGIEQAGKLATSYTENVFGKVQGIGAEIYKATGGSTSLIDSIQEAFTSTALFPAELAKYGIGFEELSESMVNLSQRSGEFATASEQIQKEIGITTAKLERLGVSTETSAELFNTMRLNFGFSASEFTTMADEMVNNASAIGMSVEQYTQDFQSSFPVLSQHGTNAVRVFDNLARAAKASGMSVQELAQSMSQFDTFQSSAENASKLNFLLGSQLDTTQLLMADEAERLEMIKGAFSPAQFQNMDKFKKKAIAAAAGFSDVGAFEKAMRGDADALGALAKDNAEDLDSATQKSTAASLAFSKGLENAKDQAVLAIHDLSEVLGGKGQGLYATGKVLGAGLENLAGISQLAASAIAMLGASAGKGSAGGPGGIMKKIPFDKIKKIPGAEKILDGLKTKSKTGMGMMKNAGQVAKGLASSPVGKLLGGVGVVASVGTAVADMATSDGPIEASQVGGVAGSVIGGAFGLVAGPMGAALGSAAGQWLGKSAGGLIEEAFGETKEEQKKREQNEAEVKKLLEENRDAVRENARHAKKLAEDSEWNKNKANFRSVVGTRNAHMPTQRANN